MTARTKAQQAAIDKDVAAQRKLRGETTTKTKTKAQPKPVIAHSAPAEDELSRAEQMRQLATEAMMKIFGVDENTPSMKRRRMTVRNRKRLASRPKEPTTDRTSCRSTSRARNEPRSHAGGMTSSSFSARRWRDNRC